MIWWCCVVGSALCASYVVVGSPDPSVSRPPVAPRSSRVAVRATWRVDTKRLCCVCHERYARQGASVASLALTFPHLASSRLTSPDLQLWKHGGPQAPRPGTCVISAPHIAPISVRVPCCSPGVTSGCVDRWRGGWYQVRTRSWRGCGACWKSRGASTPVWSGLVRTPNPHTCCCCCRRCCCCCCCMRTGLGHGCGSTC